MFVCIKFFCKLFAEASRFLYPFVDASNGRAKTLLTFPKNWKLNFLSTLRLGHHDDQLDEEAIENYYRNRYNEDTAAIARSVHLSHLFCLDPEFSQPDPDLHPFQPKNS
jgi:hypothetical protein